MIFYTFSIILFLFKSYWEEQKCFEFIIKSKSVYIVKYKISLNLPCIWQSANSRLDTVDIERVIHNVAARRKELFDPCTTLAVKASAKNPAFIMWPIWSIYFFNLKQHRFIRERTSYCWLDTKNPIYIYIFYHLKLPPQSLY